MRPSPSWSFAATTTIASFSDTCLSRRVALVLFRTPVLEVLVSGLYKIGQAWYLSAIWDLMHSVHTYLAERSWDHGVWVIEVEISRLKCNDNISRGYSEPFHKWSVNDELNLRRPPCGGPLRSIFTACLLGAIRLRHSLRYFDCSAFIISFCSGFRCRSNRYYAFCARSSRKAYWCLAHQARRVLRAEWIAASTNSDWKDFSS